MADIRFYDPYGKELELWHLRAGHIVTESEYCAGDGDPELHLTVTQSTLDLLRTLAAQEGYELVPQRPIPQWSTSYGSNWLEPWQVSYMERLCAKHSPQRTSPLEGEWEAV